MALERGNIALPGRSRMAQGAVINSGLSGVSMGVHFPLAIHNKAS